jgi:hypothetical protein
VFEFRKYIQNLTMTKRISSALTFGTLVLLCVAQGILVEAFVPSVQSAVRTGSGLFRVIKPTVQPLRVASAVASDGDSSASLSSAEENKKERKQLIRKEGGLFSFYTKFGGLNLFALWHFFVSVTLGIPWYIALMVYQFFQLITGNRFDRQRKIPILISQVWGVSLMHLTRSFPVIEGREILEKFYKEYVVSCGVVYFLL